MRGSEERSGGDAEEELELSSKTAETVDKKGHANNLEVVWRLER